MLFILFRHFSSLLLLIFPSPFSSLPLIFCNFLRLSTSLVCLRRPSLFLPICLTCLTNFPPFSFYTSHATLSHPLISHSVLFLFLSILPSPLCVYFSSDRSSGTAIPQAIYRACCGEPWGFEIVYGAYGGHPLDSGFACVRNETSFKRRDRQPVQKFLARL